MKRSWVWSTAALLVLGCKTGEEPKRGANPAPPSMVYQAPSPSAREPIDAPKPEPVVGLPSFESEIEEKEKRDLAAELNSAVGVPTDCVRDFVASSPTKIRVSVSATVRPTGMIITPTAYGSGLSAAARQCIERRVETVVLRPLDQPVSEVVSTTIEIDYTPEVIVEADPGVPEPQLRNVREPLPKRPEVAPSGRAIQEPTSKWISGGFDGGRPIQEPTSRKITGPKPRPIDGYEVDENAQEWR
jgi:hypothetical protein